MRPLLVYDLRFVNRPEKKPEPSELPLVGGEHKTGEFCNSVGIRLLGQGVGLENGSRYKKIGELPVRFSKAPGVSFCLIRITIFSRTHR